MKKEMSRYKGLILSCVSMMMIVVCVCSFSFESSARSSLEYYMPINEPAKSPTQGYVLIEKQNKTTKEYSCDVLFWDVVGYDDNTNSSADTEVISTSVTLFIFQNGVDILPAILPLGANYRYSVSVATGTTCYQLAFASGSVFDHVWYNIGSNFVITGYSYYGNVSGVDTAEVQSGSISPNVVWADDKTLVEEVMLLKEEILLLRQELAIECYEIIGELGYTNECLDELKELYQNQLDEQKKTNSWLEKIWNSIQQFFAPEGEDIEESNKLENETNEKTDKLDDLNEQNKTDKVDVDSATNSVEENVDFDSISTFSNIFVYITENEYVLQMLLLVFSVALVSYVLFGKK